MTTVRDEFQSTADMLDEEASLQLMDVDELVCYRIGQVIADRAMRDELTVTVVVFLGDRVVYKAAFAGTASDNDLIIDAKRRTALMGGHGSLFERNRYLEAGTTFEVATGLGLPKYAPYGGAVPLTTEYGELVGMVVVSGLSQEQDHALAVTAIQAAVAHEMNS